jgi:hypothetical protein
MFRFYHRACPTVPQSKQQEKPSHIKSLLWVLSFALFVPPISTPNVDAASAPSVAQPGVVMDSINNDESPALRDLPPQLPQNGPGREIPRRRRLISTSSGLAQTKNDPVVQNLLGPALIPASIQNFEGISNIDQVLPPDPNGDVGPNHYVQWVNLSFAVYDKSGTLLYGPAAGNTLWVGFKEPCESTNDGDPIVLYDHLADRWLFSQVSLPNFPRGPFFQCIAVSKTPDPTGAYNRYVFKLSDTLLNDAPKFGVWPDGYYMATNLFTLVSTEAFVGASAVVFERKRMLAGKSAKMVSFDLSSVNPNFGGMLPADLDGPPPPDGTPNYFAEADDTIFGFPTDSLRIWEFHVNWKKPGTSTFGISGNPNVVLDTDPFDANLCNFSRNCIPQKDTKRKLDAISQGLMNRLQYRNFGSHQTLVVNHTVDVDNTDHAGIRWYELRDSGGGWSIYQQGTYAPDDAHRWAGSAAMDSAGNLAIGFSISSKKLFPSIHYAGRLAGDPLGILAQGEAILIDGNGSQKHPSSRWGDYTMLAVDPVDDCTFWYTSEYYSHNSRANWQTRIGSFKFPGCGGP